MATKVAANVTTKAEERKDLPGPGRELYQLVRGGLIQRGLNLRSWAASRDLSESSVRYALYGVSDSGEARRIRSLAVRAAGLTEEKE